MSVTMKDVRFYLDADEVDYPAAKALGPEAVPFLAELVAGQDLALASKAAYLAGLIRSKDSVDVIKDAATRDEPVMRVAAAASLRNLPELQAEKVMDLLVEDPDAGVRKVMVKSAQGFASVEVESRLRALTDDDDEVVAELAQESVTAMRLRRKEP